MHLFYCICEATLFFFTLLIEQCASLDLTSLTHSLTHFIPPLGRGQEEQMAFHVKACLATLLRGGKGILGLAQRGDREPLKTKLSLGALCWWHAILLPPESLVSKLRVTPPHSTWQKNVALLRLLYYSSPFQLR